MTLMAEIANHHSDLFWGNDLYHYPVGANTLEDLCQEIYPKAVQVSSATDAEQHWGWLELAYKTYGEPQWLDTCSSSAVFDSRTAGPVTLMHALINQAGTPDYGGRRIASHGSTTRKICRLADGHAGDIDPDDFMEDGVSTPVVTSDHWLMTDRMYSSSSVWTTKSGREQRGILFWAAIPGRPSKPASDSALDDSGPRINGSGSLYNILNPSKMPRNPQASGTLWKSPVMIPISR